MVTKSNCTPKNFVFEYFVYIHVCGFGILITIFKKIQISADNVYKYIVYLIYFLIEYYLSYR